MSKTMAQLPYHYGVKLRGFPSSEQKHLIKRNSDASRFIYNEMNGYESQTLPVKTSANTYFYCSTTHSNPGAATKKTSYWNF